MHTFTIARFTIQEAISRRLILAGVIISLAYIALFSLGFEFAYSKAIENATSVQNRLVVNVAIATLTVLGLYVVFFLGAFLALFLAVGCGKEPAKEPVTRAPAPGTPAQKGTPDVYRLRPGDIPNVRAITASPRRQRSSLGASGRAVFEQ